jgi:hypothetical protein
VPATAAAAAEALLSTHGETVYQIGEIRAADTAEPYVHYE